MWKLTIEDDEAQRTSLDLDQKVYTVGRGEDSDIRLTERNVSRLHCEFRQTDGGRWELTDKSSYNGSYLNGARVAAGAVALESGAVVHVGDYRLELLDTADEITSPGESVRQRRPDRLIMVIGPTPGHEFNLEGERLQAGRSEEVLISINHTSVSRVHAELLKLGRGRWEVVDQGSSNGIRINGVELHRGIIEPGDALELGDVRLRFVAAGKLFRPAVDLSQELPTMVPMGDGAVGGTDRTSTSRRVGIAAAVLLIVGVLAAVAYGMFGGAGPGQLSPGTDNAPMTKSDAEARGVVEKARELAADGKIHVAHKMLQRIPEDSPIREIPEFVEIEARWAEEMFSKAREAKDPVEKLRILNAISETSSVAAEKRKRAAELALEVDPGGRTGARRYQPARRAGGSTSNSAPAEKPEPAQSATAAGEPLQPKRFDIKARKPALVSRVASGQASEIEIRQLKAICMQDQDRACRNMAVAALKKLREKE